MVKLVKGVNDLATVNPELANQWHPTKNGDLKPTDVTSSSHEKIWWLLPYDDPNTGKHFDFEWQAEVCSRNRGIGCPFLSGKAVWPGYNDLATTNPEVAKEWHPIKNGNFKPSDVTAGSGKKVWWLLPYDDPNTGKHFDFEWKATINHRTNGINCPYLNGRALWPGFNDLATVNPELAAEWHPTKNGNLKPTDVTIATNKKVWWLLPYDDPVTGKHFNFEWKATVNNRGNNSSCPFLNGKTVWPGYNDLATTNPKLAAEWHPTKNGNLKPTNVRAGSHKKVWWYLPYDDPITGKHFDFEWETVIYDRNNKYGCPFLSGHLVWPGFNDLATVNPQLVSEWHPTKNGNLKPTDVTAGSEKKVWWYLPYDDPKTGKHFDFEWEANIYSRNSGIGCPCIFTSKTVNIICELLTNNNTKFILEKTFSNLKNKTYLRYDLYVNDCLIEIDGQQHFEPVDYFGGKKELKTRIKHDNMKNQYCADNNIPLLRIPYIYDSVKDKEKIENFVLEFIKTGQIPQEIINFYSQYKFSNYVKCVKEINDINAANENYKIAS